MIKETTFLWNKKGESEFLNSNYSRSEIRGHGNQHDWSVRPDMKGGQDFIPNGVDNFFPNDLQQAVLRSMLQKRAYHTITSVAAGKVIFQNPDGSAISDARVAELNEIYYRIGLTRKGFTKPVTQSNYLFGGTPVFLKFASDGRGFALSKVEKQEYLKFRLSTPIWSEEKEKIFSKKHYFHKDWGWRNQGKNKKVKAGADSPSWMEYQEDFEANQEKPFFVYSYEEGEGMQALDLGEEINRLRSFFIHEKDELSEFYPFPTWYSGSTFNYVRAEFLLSCFDIDDIENGLHASGIVKVYHKAYKNPESGEAISTFENHKKLIEERFKGAWNSGSITIVPVGIDGAATADSIEFEPINTNNTKDRHEILDKRIKQSILSANGAIYSELFGVQDERSTLSEGDGKLIAGLKLLNEFTIKPLKALLDDPDDGFLNIVNDLLGIKERAIIAPNLAAFLDISPDLARYFLHPDQWFEMLQDFGLSKPTVEQQASGLVPAYIKKTVNVNTNTNGTL